MLDDKHAFTVTDVKQFTYCPRIIFYERCLPHVRPRTYKMDAGRDAHEEEQTRAARRTLAAYGVPEGERHFNVALQSVHRSLTGILDEVVKTSSGEVFPVDYKLAKQVSKHHKLQLTAYAILLEEASSVPVTRGFIYLIPTRESVEIAITAELRTEAEQVLAAITTMVTLEQMPEPTTNRNYCTACEFRRFCNDV